MNINLKKVISSVAALAMAFSCFTAFAADFTDVEATASYKAAIDELVALEIVNGYEDGSFKPDNEITRAEVTKMVVAAMGDSYTAAAESSKGTSGFADVDAANHWASGFISVGVAQKFINGMGDGTFAPDSNVTYAQIVKMLVAALGYDSAAALAGGYPNGYLQIGAQIGVTAGVTGLAADTAVTRANVAQLISNALDTPLVVVTGWSQNYVTGEPIAETDVMDGTEGKAYKTLLTENHDTYVVKGRVTGTFATGAAEVGTVAFDVEYADNFEGVYTIDEKTNPGSTTSIVAYFGDTNAEDLLFTYAEALVAVDENDEYTILTITPYGRNEIVELAADDYAKDDYADSVPGADDGALTVLEFNKSATSTKTDKYEIAPTVKFYVNGRLVKDGAALAPSYVLDGAEVDSYIAGNEVGTVTLINSPAAGSTSLDRYYDVIMVTVPKWAVVEETLSSGDVNKIVFSDFESGVGAYVNMDTTDEDAIYTFYKNGEEIAFEDIAAGDVALLVYDVVGGAANAANRIVFEFCDTIVEGMVTGLSSDGKYTVNGEEYELLSTLSALEVSYEYSLKLDAAGRVVKYDELATAKNYGVIDRVSYSTNEDAYVARIIKADGTRENVAIKTTGVIKDDGNAMTTGDGAASTAKDLYNVVYGATLDAIDNIKTGKMNDGTTAIDSTLAGVASRIAAYKINSKGELNTVEFIAGVTASGAEYKESSMKIGSYRINDATAVVDATKVGVSNIDNASNYTASDIAANTADMFVDGEAYTVVLADKGQDNCYKFALVLAGNASVALNTGFAVVDSVASAIDEADGEVKTTITVLDANGQGELITYFVDEDLSIGTPDRGAVVALGIENDIVVAYKLLFDEFTTTNVGADDITFAEAASIFSGATKAYDPADTDGTQSTQDSFFLQSGVSAWDTTTLVSPNGWARTGFGMIVNKNGSTVTFATGSETTYYSATSTSAIKTATNVVEYDLDSDVNVYVVDMNYADKQDAGRIAVGSTGSVMKTPGTNEVETFTGASQVGPQGEKWSLENVINGEANYAYFKVVENEITEIVVFVPAN